MSAPLFEVVGRRRIRAVACVVGVSMLAVSVLTTVSGGGPARAAPPDSSGKIAFGWNLGGPPPIAVMDPDGMGQAAAGAEGLGEPAVRGAPQAAVAPVARSTAAPYRAVNTSMHGGAVLVPATHAVLVGVYEGFGGADSDLNGDGDKDDRVASVWDRRWGIEDLGIAMWDVGSVPAGEAGFVIAVSEHDQGQDLNGNGNIGEMVLHAFHEDTGLANLGLTSGGAVATSEGAAFAVAESVHGDLNGDGDDRDEVVHVYDAATGAVANTGLDGPDVNGIHPLASGVAVSVDEHRQGATDLNGDGDDGDHVYQVFIPGQPTANTGVARSGAPAQLPTGELVFTVNEHAQGADLNGDGDDSDSVYHVWDPIGGATNLGLAGWSMPVVSGTELALRVSEFGHFGIDLNGDGDAADDVLHVWDSGSGAVNLGLAAGEVVPLTGGFGFGVGEESQGDSDLNGDGDTLDFVVHVHRGGSTSNLGLGYLLPGGDPGLHPNGDWMLFGVPEEGKADLNGNGSMWDVVAHTYQEGVGVSALTEVVEWLGPVPLGDGIAFGGYDDVHVFEPGEGTTSLGVRAVNPWAGSDDLLAWAAPESPGGDLNGDGDSDDEVVHVALPNIFPIANDDLYLVTSGGVVDEPGPGVLGNDSDPQSDAITVISYTDPTEGTLEIYTDGSFTYTHNGTDTTGDTFTYWAGDGTDLSNEATVWITVNDPPIAVDDGPYSVDVAGTLVETPPGLLANDSDPDGDPLIAHSYGDPAHGTLTVSGDGSFIYTHDGSNTTSDSFGYRATDGISLSNEATVSLTINPVIDLELTKDVAPAQVTSGDQTTFTVSVTNQGPSDATGVTMRDSLPSGLTHVSDNGGGSFDPATGLWTVGDLSASTTATLELVVAVDQAGTFVNVAEVAAADQPDADSTPNNNVSTEDDLDNAAVTAVEPPNQAPIAADDGPYTVAQGETLTVNGVLDNDSDPDGDPLTAVKSTGPAHGTLTLNPNGSFVYVHDGTATTTDSFTYRANDGKHDSNIATVAITITPVQVLPGTLEPTSVGLVDPTQGKWYLRDYDTGTVTSFFYGNPGDIPFMGDWNCNGEATPGLFRQSDAYAYLRNSNTVGVADIRFYFGDPSDVPLAGDFNGDGCDTLSIYRPSEQRFYVMNELGENEGGLGAAEYAFTFGNPGDKPVVGDWDGDGIDEVGLHRESTGFFYYRNTLDVGIADGQFYFGDPADRFVAGDWGTIDGVETPAVFRPSTTTFYFRWTNTPGAADSEFVWGESGWLPISGVLDRRQ